MAKGKRKCCEKKFLYEVEAPGLVYLSLDGRNPVYVGFQHKLKLEICLVNPEGQLQTFLSSGKLERTWGINKATLNESKKSTLAEKLDSTQSHPEETEESIKLMSLLEMEVVPVSELKADDMVNQSHEIDENHSKFGAPITKTHVQTKRKQTQVNFKPVNQESENDLQTFRAKTRKVNMVVEQEKTEELQLVREKARAKLLKLRMQQKRGSVVLSRDQLHIFLSKSSKKTKMGESLEKTERSAFVGQENDAEVEGVNQDESLEAHTSTEYVSLEKPIVCKYCAKTFTSKKEYYKHRKYTTLNYHVCLKCNTAFPFRAYLLVHMKYHNEKVPRSSYKCDQCDFKSSRLTDLKKHMIIHTHEHCFQCCQCFKTFVTQTLLLKHLASHRPKGLIKCSCCNQFFPSRAALADHRMAHVKPSCGLCGKVFPNKASRLIHYKTDHMETILRCPECGRMYSHQDELARHQLMHKQRRRQQCPTCGAMVLKLAAHLRAHKSVDEIPDSELFMCDQCPSKFKTSSQLRNHMRTHSEEKYKCHLCPKSCATSSGLARHLNNVHSDLMPHQCEICGKQCKQKSNLRVHMRIHSNTKMFPCSFCDQAFNYKASLQGHLRSKHSLEVTARPDFVSSVNNLSSSKPMKREYVPGASTAQTVTCSTRISARGSSMSSSQPLKSSLQYSESSSWNVPDSIQQDTDGHSWEVDLSNVSNTTISELGGGTPDLASASIYFGCVRSSQQ